MLTFKFEKELINDLLQSKNLRYFNHTSHNPSSLKPIKQNNQLRIK